MLNSAPSKIKLHRKSCILELEFNGKHFELSAEYLRVHSPSAEIKGHGPGEEVLQLNKENVAITNVQAQGNYAIKLIFSDGHDSGIYSWQYLLELAENHQQYWEEYLAKVNADKQQKEEAETNPVKWVEP